MQKKSFILLLILFPLLTGSSYAGKVDISKAKRTGINFYYEQINQYQDVPYDQVRIKESFAEKYNGAVVYYVFNLAQQGFVIVSADDAVTPVLAYSFDGTFARENQPPQFIAWMEGYAKQIDYSFQNHLNQSLAVKNEWDHLQAGDPSGLNVRRSSGDVPPLLISTWDQGFRYNDLCPVDPAGPGDHVWAGCVATAMSQVMYYYRWPQTGSGSHCYVPQGYPEQCADFGSTNYKWYEMLNSLNDHDTSVAELIWHAGVGVDMMYSPNGSGAYSEDAAAAMINYFKYNPNTELIYKDNYTEDTWTGILRDNLNQNRPMYYHGFGSGGHAFNVDGYQGTDYFHFNWGWSGSYNGYFYLNNLNPGGANFTYGQGAIVNIYPDTVTYTYPSYCNGQVVLTALSGTFEDGSGPKNYKGNASCSWLIQPQGPSDSVISITIWFNRFNTEAVNDVVKIYQGSSTTDSLVASFSGENVPPAYTVTGNQALVTFSSNGLVSKPGWFITYTSESMDWCDNMTTLTEPQGTLSDGSLNFDYKNKTFCLWAITPENTGAVIFTFNDFNTEAGKDLVKFYDMESGQLLATYSGNYTSGNLPPPVTVPSGKMFIAFTSNVSGTNEGWSGYYSSYPVGMQEMTVPGKIVIYPNPSDENFTIRFNDMNQQNLKIELKTLDGKTLMHDTFNLSSGNSEKHINVSWISAGVYVLKMTGDKETFTRKIVIQ